MSGTVLGTEDPLSDCHTSHLALESSKANHSLAALNKNVTSHRICHFSWDEMQVPCTFIVPSH